MNRVPLSHRDLTARLRARLVKLKPGDVISLGVPIQTPVTVRIGNHAKFRGRLVAPDVNVGVLVESSTDSDRNFEEA